MVVRQSFYRQRINREGIFDLKKLYGEVKDYLSNLKYRITEKDSSTKLSSKGTEVMVEFNCEREVDDYIKFLIQINFLITGLKQVKVNGKTLNRGLLQITVASGYELDYANKWVKSKFADIFHKFYRKHLIKDKINIVYEGKLYGEVINLMSLMKEILDLYRE